MGVKSKEGLEEDIIVIGNALLSPEFSSVDQLLCLLDRLDGRLQRVNQEPSSSMLRALSPAEKALVSGHFLNHSDVDVRVSVALCINEILRITAPISPYGDEQMKEIFELILSAFENIDDTSSPSYPKRVSILEVFARLRLGNMMLDLKCDPLILQMFSLFLANIREYHPDVVFSSMGSIMILVLEEMEQISPDLLGLLVDCVRKGNQGFLPIARKLVERVIENCASEVTPFMCQTVRQLGFPLENYSKIVVNICENASETLGYNETLHLGAHAPVKDQVLPDGSASRRRRGRPKKEGSMTNHLRHQSGREIGPVCKVQSQSVNEFDPEDKHVQIVLALKCAKSKADVMKNELGVRKLRKILTKEDLLVKSGDNPSSKHWEGIENGRRVKGSSSKDLNSTIIESNCSMETPKPKLEKVSTLWQFDQCPYVNKSADNHDSGSVIDICYVICTSPECGKQTYVSPDDGDDLIGYRIRMWRPKYNKYHECVIDSYDPMEKKHKVLYADGNEETLVLREEDWYFVGVGYSANRRKLFDHSSPDAHRKPHRRKKAKTNSNCLAEEKGESFKGKLYGQNDPENAGSGSTSDNKMLGNFGDVGSNSAVVSGEETHRTCLDSKHSAVNDPMAEGLPSQD